MNATHHPFTDGLRCEHGDCTIPLVSVSSGPHLRCGCGRTTMDRPPPPPPADPNIGLRQLLDVLREYRVVEYRQGEVSLRFAPDAFRNEEQDSKATTGACKCGHDPTEHNEYQECLRGCDVLVCHPRPEGAAA